LYPLCSINSLALVPTHLAGTFTGLIPQVSCCPINSINKIIISPSFEVLFQFSNTLSLRPIIGNNVLALVLPFEAPKTMVLILHCIRKFLLFVAPIISPDPLVQFEHTIYQKLRLDTLNNALYCDGPLP
jgi:hypothetical protein